MKSQKGQIGSNNVDVVLGDMTKIESDAYIVPQFTGAASYGGVGGAVARAGAEEGLAAYQRFIDQKGEQKFGQVVLTKSGGGRSSCLLHVVSVGSGEEDEFNTIQTAFFNALKVAESQGIESIASPAMGTGIIGSLTAEQSANAMMSAADQYAAEGGKPIKLSFVIYGDESAYNAFVTVLQSGVYKTAKKEKGRKEFNIGEWIVGMQRDADANGERFGR
jgi:O-acetyl-ADP-ribose deacetylase (regulator of RNase III)